MRNTTDRPFDFFRGKIKLYQPPEHRVSVDLVLFLSRIRGVKRSSRVIDLGAGFGFLSIAIAKKYKVPVVALELDRRMLELLKKNVELNELSHLITVVEGDVRKVDEIFKKGSFDVVITNPPFFPPNFTKNPNPYHFETRGTLKDFIKAGGYLLRDGGYMNLLIPSFRLYESFLVMGESKVYPRFLSLVYPTEEKRARLGIVTGIKNVGGGLECDKPLIINKKTGEYTEEVRNLLESFL
ncbi:MAG: methyltransferase [Aquificae bacterium]|nr:methyltransferase [Aquificota bacterium]